MSNNSSNTPNQVTIHILGKEYQIACPAEEEISLTKAAQNLDRQMRKIRDSGKVIGVDRIAIMAALNLSHELLQTQTKNVSISTESQDLLSRVNQKLDNALNRFGQLEL